MAHTWLSIPLPSHQVDCNLHESADPELSLPLLRLSHIQSAAALGKETAMHPSKVRRTLASLAALAMLTFAATACGRGYHVTGRVVLVQPSSPYADKITEVTGKPIPQEGTPIAGATVRMILRFDGRGNPSQDPNLWLSTVTNAQGQFDLDEYGAPGRKRRATLEASHPAYGRLQTTFVDDFEKEPQTFFIAFISPLLSPTGFRDERVCPSSSVPSSSVPTHAYQTLDNCVVR